MIWDFSRRMKIAEVKSAAEACRGREESLTEIWELVHSENQRVSYNALWVLSHLPRSEMKWVDVRKDEMIDSLLQETDVGKKRIYLHLLRSVDYAPESVRTDFLDYCLSKINSQTEPYAVRAFCIHIAYKLCRHFPELTDELKLVLSQLSFQHLSPGLKSAYQQTIRKISSGS